MKKLPKNLIKAFIGAIFVLGIFVISKPEQASADGCVVSAAGFRHLVPTTNPANFYHDQNRPVVYIDFMTQGCQGSSFEFSITQAIGLVQVDDLVLPDSDAVNIDNLSIPVPVGGPDNFTVLARAGEDGCGTGSFPGGFGIPNEWDCSFYLSVFDSNGESLYNTIPVAENGGLNVSGGGMLEYECSDFCDVPWQIIPPFIIEFQGVLESDQFNQPVGPGLSIPEGDFYLAPLPGFPSNQPTNLGDFLRGFFRVLIVVAGILAFIMIVIGAITWASSDAISGKGDGKQMIQDAILGLVLALGAWVILNTINPNLASNLGITIPTVSISAGDADYFGSNASTDSSGTITGFSPLPSNLNLYCPLGGGVSSVAQVIDSFQNKTTYRWGGKGGALPSGGQYKLSPGEQQTGPRLCTNENGQSVECRSFCPSNSVCLDCSGFVNQVRRCTGLPTFGGTSSMVNSGSAIAIEPNNISSDGQSISIGTENYVFQPGDILVWNGHTVIYYGGGLIAESSGEFTTNTNITKKPLASYSNKQNITHLIKVQ